MVLQVRMEGYVDSLITGDRRRVVAWAGYGAVTIASS